MNSNSGFNFNINTTKSTKLSDSDISKMWEQFVRNTSDKELKDKIIIQYIYLIKYVVGRLRITLPNTISTEDIAGYGVEGLIDAIEKFRPERNVKFETYALLRIRGAVIDRIRSLDWVPRGAQKRFKKIHQAIATLQGRLGRQPRTEEIAAELELPKEKVEASIAEMESHTLISIYDKRDSSGESAEIIDTIQDKNIDDPLVQLENRDVKNELSRALGKLPERERMLLALYYHENMTLKEIGGILNISESRVCQLHAQAVMKLRKLLSAREVDIKSRV